MTTARHMRAYLGTAVPVLLLVVAVMGFVAWCPSALMASPRANCADRACVPITMRGVQAQDQQSATPSVWADAAVPGAPAPVPSQWILATLPTIVGVAPERPGDPLFGRLLI
jgi:hypothetical protein